MGQNSCRTGSGKRGKVKALRRHGGFSVSGNVLSLSRPEPANKNAQELHATILFFAVLSRFITEIERAATLGFKNGFPVSRI